MAKVCLIEVQKENFIERCSVWEVCAVMYDVEVLSTFRVLTLSRGCSLLILLFAWMFVVWGVRNCVSCLASGCLTSSCLMSGCLMSGCLTSSCLTCGCLASGCLTSGCLMSGCLTSGCLMSDCLASS